MEYKASHRFADMTARKIRPFATLIRGKAVDEALQLLKFAPNRGARLLEKVVQSAMGNAADRGVEDVEDLIVSESRVDDGPMFKRIMPRSRGTANMIFRRISHIHVALSEVAVEEVSVAPKAVAVTQPKNVVAPAPAVSTTPPSTGN